MRRFWSLVVERAGIHALRAARRLVFRQAVGDETTAAVIDYMGHQALPAAHGHRGWAISYRRADDPFSDDYLKLNDQIALLS